jgi:hypothetical protein
VNAPEGPVLWKHAHAVTGLGGRVFWGSNKRPKEMIEDKATEKLKKRLQDMGLIVNAGADKVKPKSVATEKRDPESKKGGKK